MILDKLVEKKDVEAYIDMRINFLKQEMETEILKLKPNQREYVKERFKGRIDELSKLKTVIKNNELKDKSKIYYKKIDKE